MPYGWNWQAHSGRYDYSESVLGRKRADRARRDLTSYEQQRARRDTKFWGELEQRRHKGRTAETIIERQVARQVRKADPIAKLEGLARKWGKERGEVGLIPYGQFRRVTGLDPQRYQRATVIQKGSRYIRWDRGGLDEVADALGMTDTQLVDAINRRVRHR